LSPAHKYKRIKHYIPQAKERGEVFTAARFLEAVSKYVLAFCEGFRLYLKRIAANAVRSTALAATSKAFAARSAARPAERAGRAARSATKAAESAINAADRAAFVVRCAEVTESYLKHKIDGSGSSYRSLFKYFKIAFSQSFP
jgi:hypothetical protein